MEEVDDSLRAPLTATDRAANLTAADRAANLTAADRAANLTAADHAARHTNLALDSKDKALRQFHEATKPDPRVKEGGNPWNRFWSHISKCGGGHGHEHSQFKPDAHQSQDFLFIHNPRS